MFTKVLLYREVLFAEFVPSLRNSLLANPAELGTCRTGDSNQALANKILLAFNTAKGYQVIASSL